MQINPDTPPRIVPPADSRVIRAFGDEIIVHLSAEDTGNQSSVWTNITPPGGGPPPHYHTREDEWFFPLEGRVEFLHEGAWREVPMGTAVYMPKHAVHAFRNPGDIPLRMLIQTMPGGMEQFFDRCAAVFAEDGPPDMEKIIQISAEFGVFYVD